MNGLAKAEIFSVASECIGNGILLINHPKGKDADEWGESKVICQLTENMKVPMNDCGSGMIAGSRHITKTPIDMKMILTISDIFLK